MCFLENNTNERYYYPIVNGECKSSLRTEMHMNKTILSQLTKGNENYKTFWHSEHELFYENFVSSKFWDYTIVMIH